MRYLSLFSGAGGLESAAVGPVLACEIDRECWPVLRTRMPHAELHDDVTTLLDPPEVDVVAGGWPCQDISVAGLRRGLHGKRSGLFFALLDVVRAAGAHTVVAENVPHLLQMERGDTFRSVLEAFRHEGFAFVAWRTINAREFGLPHERRRVFIVASRHPEIARALHRPAPGFPETVTPPQAHGFYWTAGLQSINYSDGFVPTLKVGSSLSIPSPPAVHFGSTVRKLTGEEALRLQGFDARQFGKVSEKVRHRIAGNAVAVPAGSFAMSSVELAETTEVELPPTRLQLGESFDVSVAPISAHGLYDASGGGAIYAFNHRTGARATNLHEFLDLALTEPLSRRAASGLLNRIRRSGKPLPSQLRSLLEEIAAVEASDSHGVYDTSDQEQLAIF